MSLQIFAYHSIGTGVRADLGTADNLFIGVDAIVGRTDGSLYFHNAVQATGSNQRLDIRGAIISTGTAIDLSNLASANDIILIAKTGLIQSFYGSGIRILGDNQVLKTAGDIWAQSFGIVFGSNTATDILKITNSGSIVSDANTAISRFVSTAGTAIILNTGIIEGTKSFAGSGTTPGVDQIVNKGTMIGNADLGGGNDLYDGRVGKIAGAVYGENGDDVLLGGLAAEKLSGDAGNDRLEGYDGNDMLLGGTGADTLYGAKGADILDGGTDGDRFIFRTISDSTVAASGRDTIFNFQAADRIDISAIDANTARSGNQAFSFIGTKAFAGKAGDLRYDKNGSGTNIYADVNGDKKVDFAIHLDDTLTMHKEWFIL